MSFLDQCNAIQETEDNFSDTSVDRQRIDEINEYLEGGNEEQHEQQHQQDTQNQSQAQNTGSPSQNQSSSQLSSQTSFRPSSFVDICQNDLDNRPSTSQTSFRPSAFIDISQNDLDNRGPSTSQTSNSFPRNRPSSFNNQSQCDSYTRPSRSHAVQTSRRNHPPSSHHAVVNNVSSQQRPPLRNITNHNRLNNARQSEIAKKRRQETRPNVANKKNRVDPLQSIQNIVNGMANENKLATSVGNMVTQFIELNGVDAGKYMMTNVSRLIAQYENNENVSYDQDM